MTLVREDDWKSREQFDAIQRLAYDLSQVKEVSDALRTSGAAYKLTLGNFANDAAASAGGVQVGQLYRNGSVVQVRVA